MSSELQRRERVARDTLHVERYKASQGPVENVVKGAVMQ